MIRPYEMSLGLPMEVADQVISTTDKVWEILLASRNGDLEKVKELRDECPELIYAQYNYTPPIHFAVREGHTDLVRYLLNQGAHEPGYKMYPFREPLDTIAEDRGYHEIAILLKDYAADPARKRYSGDNGRIFFERTNLQAEFEKVVDRNDVESTELILKEHPEFAKDETYFWGEGILLFAAKKNQRAMADLLLFYGAKVPEILKWVQFYYFERLDGATYMMEKGMNPNTMSWHHVTILHDMAQKGDLTKAELLLKYGAEINAIEEEYQSTPLGLAARWGHLPMVEYLLKQGADPNLAGADWSAPLAWAEKKGHDEIARLIKLYR
ncbi:ankyrin repeat domain-containing protein [Mucilaginibacter angelicae]|uniref:Ankyrin repeat domain-containing protein n=1 Tax=Mucilaginibacter angelicae TaxID=869718 RepID=A0ABV6L5R8_9SPHI